MWTRSGKPSPRTFRRTTQTRGSRRWRTRSTGWRSAPSTTGWRAASQAQRCLRTTFSRESRTNRPDPTLRVDSKAMEVIRITPRGYCHGVVDAFRIAKRVREETNGPVHMLGMLVHNTHATDDLQAQGIALVDQPDRFAGLNQIKEGTVIFTAHGVSPQVKQRAIELGLKPVDATCSDVVRTHELVADLANKGYDVVYI